MKQSIGAGLVLLACALSAVSCSSDKSGDADGKGAGAAGGGASVTLKGAGATFPAPIYKQWFAAYKQETNTSVDYQAVGSGQGYKAIKDKTADFGASDAPLSEDEEKALPGPVMHLPTVGGAVVLTYNLPGVQTGLHFTPEAIAGIYLGKITKWSDPALKSANPTVNLPDTPIQPVFRTDSSGTTYIFTNYLKKVSADWAAGPGSGKSINFPVGQGGPKSDGVTANVKRTPGAIGYVELTYAIQNKLPYGDVKNAAGAFVTPSAASTTAAIKQYVSELSKDIKTPTVNAPGADSYPICSLTYILIYKTGGSNPGPTTKLWSWAMQPKQQQMAAALNYAPLPAELVKLNLDNLKTVQGGEVTAAQ